MILMSLKILFLYQVDKFILHKMNQDSEEEKNNQVPLETLQKIEEGDLHLRNQIQNGILFLGDTKVGKTTCCHYLLGHCLIGKYNDVGNVVYDVEGCDSKFFNARIGTKESESETQIPNLFDTKLSQNKLVTLIDCPGYGDTNGCSFKISNGYFHYRIFSLVRNLKFVFVIQFGDLSGKAQKLKSAFTSLVGSFQVYDDIESNFLNAAAMIITKVPKNLSNKQVEERLCKLKNPFKSEKPSLQFKNFRDHIVSEGKLFVVHRPQLKQTYQGQISILRAIQNKTTPWIRQLNKQNNGPEMKYIKTSIRDDLFSPKSQDELQEARQYLQRLSGAFRDTFFQKIKLMQKLFERFITEIFEQGETTFIQLLKDSKKSVFFSQNSICNDKRKTIQHELFNIKKDNSIQSKQKTCPFWLRKIKAGQNLERKSKGVPENIYNTQSLELLREYAYESLNQLLTLLKKKQDKELMISFSYQILKIMQISNIFYHIMSGQSSEKQLEMAGFIITEYPSLIQDNFKGLFTYSLLPQKIHYIQSVNIAKISITTEEIAETSNFFLNLSIQIQNEQNKTILLDEGFDIEKINQIIKSVKKKNFQHEINAAYLQIKSLNQVVPDLNKLKKINKFLYEILLKIQEELKQCTRDSASKQRLKFLKTRCLSLLGKILELSSLNKNSIKVYDSMVNLYKVKELYKIQEIKFTNQHQKQKITNQEFIKFFIEFMIKLMKYNDMQTAKAIGIRAYHYAVQYGEMQQYFIIQKLMQKLYSIEKSDVDFLGETKFLGGVNFDISDPLNYDVYEIIKKNSD